MSFAEDVKNELCRYVLDDPLAQKVEVSALLRVRGSLILGLHGNVGIRMATANNAVARRVLSLLKNNYTIETSVMIRKGLTLRKKNMVTITAPPSKEVRGAMEDLRLWPPTNMLSQNVFKSLEVRRAFLRGAFLGGGSVNKPQSYYHLEFITTNYSFAKQILQHLKYFSIAAKITERKEEYVVYVKEGDGVTSCLQIMGASQSMLAFEEVRVVKEMRNQINRQVNCETANLQKTVDAAVSQLQAIKALEEAGVLQDLPFKLQEAAQIRKDNPSMSLRDMVPLFTEKISKSGVNHRFKKLEALAKPYLH